MIRVRVYPFRRTAEYYFREWTREHEAEIQGINRAKRAVVLRNGDELHFVTESGFERWSRGKHWVEENGYED